MKIKKLIISAIGVASSQIFAAQLPFIVYNGTNYPFDISNSSNNVVCTIPELSTGTCELDTVKSYKASYMGDQNIKQELFVLQNTTGFQTMVHNPTTRNASIPDIHISVKITDMGDKNNYGDYSVYLDDSGKIQSHGTCKVPQGNPITVECWLYGSVTNDLKSVQLTVSSAKTPWKPVTPPAPLPTYKAKNGMQYNDLGTWNPDTQQQTNLYAPNWSTTPTTFKEVEYNGVTYVACSQPNKDTVDPEITAKNGWGPWFTTDNTNPDAKKC